MATYYEKNISEDIPIMNTNKIFLGRNEYNTFIDRPQDTFFRLSSPVGFIRITDTFEISANTTFNKPIKFNANLSGTSIMITNHLYVGGESVLYGGFASSGHSYINNTLTMTGPSNKFEFAINSPYVDAFGTEGHVFAGSFAPSAATGYIRIKIGDIVGYIPMYSGGRITGEES